MAAVTGRVPLPAGASHPAFRAAAGHTTVRRANLSLVLRLLAAEGAMSRAAIATRTGLNKATSSSLVAELLDRGLVVETGLERLGSVGRPGLAVALSGARVAGVGVELNADFVDVTALDLGYAVVATRRTARDLVPLSPPDALDVVARAVGEVVADVGASGHEVVGVTMAFPGLIGGEEGTVAFAPHLPWQGVPLASALREALRRLVPALDGVPVLVDNDANLGAIAEHALGVGTDVGDLVYVGGEVGVGGGLVVGGRLVRGVGGFSGEVGHLPLNPEPVPCGCGRLGCWETQVGLSVLFRLAAAGGDDPLLDPHADIEARLRRVATLAEAGDARVLAALDRVATDLGTGVSVLLNLLNPGTVVLGGYFAVLGDRLLPRVREVVAARVVAPGAGGSDVRPSRLGFTAASRGGAVVALQRVLDDPTVVPPVQSLVP
jgi:predicted NBD/HSP70 family sugar kinase